MPVTSKYALPWPSPAAFLRNGAAAMGELAEAVEAALRPPLIVTDGDGALAWAGDKVAEVPWDITDNPDRKRGTWTSPTPNAERLVIPSLSGWYYVSTTVTLAPKAAGTNDPDSYDVRITTRAQGSGSGTGAVWGRSKVDVPNTTADDSAVTLSTIVRIPDASPPVGFAVRVSYKGATAPPATTAGSNKLRAYRLSAL